MKKQVGPKATAKVPAAASVSSNDLYPQAVEILKAKADTPLNVLAGKLKTTIGEATKLLSRYRQEKTAKRMVDELPAKAKAQLAKSLANAAPKGTPDVVKSNGTLEEAKTQRVETAKKRAEELYKGNAAFQTQETSKRGPYKKRLPKSLSKLGNAFASELQAAGFDFIKEQNNAYGYQHADGRAVIHIVTKKGERWQVKYPNGSVDEGNTAEELRGVLTVEEKEAEAQEAATTLAEDIANEKRSKSTPKVITVNEHTLPAHVVRAVEMLGGMSLQRYDLSAMAGKKFDEQRAKLLTQLLGRAVKKGEATVEALQLAFYNALSVPEAHPVARQAEFTIAAKKVSVEARKAKTEAKKAEQDMIHKAERATVQERTVAGTILPIADRIGKKQRAKMDAEIVRQVLTESSTAEPIYAPHADAQVQIIPADLHLLEDRMNGLVLLQLEKANSQGAICVYNNGSRVAAGVVAPTTLSKLRRIELSKVSQGISSNEMILQAAHQLLNSAAAGFPVTSVAARHLTAVIHCKELVPVAKKAAESASSKEDDNDMANENGNKKFASPKSNAKSAKKAAAKSEKPTKKAAVKASNGEAAGRRSKFTEDQTIVKKFKDGDEHPYRAGTARHDLLNAAAKAGTVGKYLKAAGEPSGGSATSYLNLFVKEGHLVVK